MCIGIFVYAHISQPATAEKYKTSVQLVRVMDLQALPAPLRTAVQVCVNPKEGKTKQKFPTDEMGCICYPSYFSVSKCVAVFVVNDLYYENLFWLYLQI